MFGLRNVLRRSERTGSKKVSRLALQGFAIVLGAAASGKSSFAESIIRAEGRRPVYVATAEAHDGEMAAKIAAHRQRRAGQGWRTVEAPLEPAAAVAAATSDEAVLIDCATLWLSNLMLAGRAWEAEADRLLAAIVAAPVPVVVVTNEVGAGVVPETPLGRRFRAAQGQLNQRLAAAADLVVLVVAGLPLALKGTLGPELHRH